MLFALFEGTSLGIENETRRGNIREYTREAFVACQLLLDP